MLLGRGFEAQQRYFSYGAMLVATIPQNSFVLVLFLLESRNYRAICCKMGIAQMCLYKTTNSGGGIAPFWGSANRPDKVSRDMGHHSDSIAISCDMGPLRGREFTNVRPKSSFCLEHGQFVQKDRLCPG